MPQTAQKPPEAIQKRPPAAKKRALGAKNRAEVAKTPSQSDNNQIQDGNGHNGASKTTIEWRLDRIEDEQREIKAEIRNVGVAVDTKVSGVRADMNAGFARVDADIRNLRSETTAGFATLRADMNAGFARVDGDISNLRSDTNALRSDVAASFARVDAKFEKMVEFIRKQDEGVLKETKSSIWKAVGTIIAVMGLFFTAIEFF